MYGKHSRAGSFLSFIVNRFSGRTYCCFLQENCVHNLKNGRRIAPILRKVGNASNVHTCNDSMVMLPYIYPTVQNETQTDEIG